MTVRTAWHMPVILISFVDDTLQYGAPDFERMLFDTTHAMPNGSAAEYYTSISGGQFHFHGRVVAKVKLAHTQAYYADGNSGLNWYDTPRNSYGLLKDVLQACEASVYWPEFDLDYDGYVDMVWLVHANVGGEGGDPAKLWSLTSRSTAGWLGGSPYQTSSIVPGTFDRPMLIDRFSILPELSLFHDGALSEIGVFCHEFGHALGLPDLYDVANPSNYGPGCWSLMSTGAYGGDGASPELPTHMGAWPMRFLGWARNVRPTTDSTLTLEPMEREPQVADFWFQGRPSFEHFLIENREPIGYDQKLPGRGLIVYHVNERVMSLGLAANHVNSTENPGLVVVEGDDDADLTRGWNRGDANDPFPGALGLEGMDDFSHPSTRAFDRGITNIALQQVSLDGDQAHFRLRVDPAGWLPAADFTGPGYSPTPTRSSARASGRDVGRVEHVVISELEDGHPQIALRSSLAWDHPFVLSASSAAALDPALAVLPSGDLAVAWSDSRRGRFDVYYRARIRGTWTDERPIVALTGNCRSPSLACDGRGGLYLAFQYQSAETLKIMFARFNYAAPRVQPQAVVVDPFRPESPLVVAGKGGRGYLLWQDRRPLGQLWFSTFAPDSAVSESQTLTDWTSGQTAFTAALDSAGVLHVLRSVTGPGTNQLLYLERGPGGNPIPELTLESPESPLESMSLEVDDQFSVHLTYCVSGAGLRLRYRRLWPDLGWDVASTDLSFPYGETGGQPVLLPRWDGNVDLVYTGQKDGASRFMVRQRVLHEEGQVAVEPAGPLRIAPRLVLAPNPVRSGVRLAAWLARVKDEPAPALEVFDAAGRKRATLRLYAAGAAWRAELDPAQMLGWEDGVYFARLKSSPAPASRFVVIH